MMNRVALLFCLANPIAAQEIIVSKETDQYQRDSVFALRIVDVLAQRALDIRMGQWRIHVRFVPVGTPEQNYSGITTVKEAYNVAFIQLDLDDFRTMTARTIDETVVHELMHVISNKVGEAMLFNTTGRVRKLNADELESLVTTLSRMFIWRRW